MTCTLRVFLARLFLLLLLKSRELGVLRAILPVVHNVIACNDYMSFVHGDKLGLNRDVLVFNWASDCIAQYNDPLPGLVGLFGSRLEPRTAGLAHGRVAEFWNLKSSNDVCYPWTLLPAQLININIW